MDPPAQFHPLATRRVVPTVRVGVGVVVVHGDHTTGSRRLYAGVRRGSHGATRLALPGGHLEMYESWSDCAIREVQEEMGITLDDVRYLHVTNDVMEDEEKHYVTIFMVGWLPSTDPPQIPENKEPDKCEGWKAYTLDELSAMLGSDRLFLPLEHMLKDRPPQLVEWLTCQTIQSP